ncbi:hypothetical protein [Clostridium isatidis]|uniref:Uncharacterized protein n=1 Tax=Clostridium isatidis TaxID=182773 RepID=A0A343JAM9_9CLOT|nr:hypothetical protein [Clostridium isatidis]ASW42587.1 hypothetical protein BEN51_03575 [Clostridium isatidis]NLZ35287.1 hypothetical protein [Clostridiales bacterium]
MAVAFKDINFSRLVDKLSPCCLSKETCGVCDRKNCLVGYGTECIKECMINKVTYVMNGYENIPITDTKVYDKENIMNGIIDILKLCKNCKENHFNNCIVNILRSCYEVILLGEEKDYKGSALLYINDLKASNPEIADELFKRYMTRE